MAPFYTIAMNFFMLTFLAVRKLSILSHHKALKLYGVWYLFHRVFFSDKKLIKSLNKEVIVLRQFNNLPLRNIELSLFMSAMSFISKSNRVVKFWSFYLILLNVFLQSLQRQERLQIVQAINGSEINAKSNLKLQQIT